MEIYIIIIIIIIIISTGMGIFLFTTASRMALGPTQPPIQLVSGALSLGVKRPGCEADHSHPSSAEVRNAWSYTSNPPIRLHARCLIRHRGSFIISITLVKRKGRDTFFLNLEADNAVFSAGAPQYFEFKFNSIS
jgi:hypothetical protein